MRNFFRKIRYFIRYRSFTPEARARKLGVLIGADCSISETIEWGSEPYLISIGNHVQITNNVSFHTHGACWVLRMEYPDIDTFGKIAIGNNVYVGAGAKLMAGIVIGDNVVIGAGAIVTKSFEQGGVVIAGVPAKIVSKFVEFKKSMLAKNMGTKGLTPVIKRVAIQAAPSKLFIKK